MIKKRKGWIGRYWVISKMELGIRQSLNEETNQSYQKDFYLSLHALFSLLSAHPISLGDTAILHNITNQ